MNITNNRRSKHAFTLIELLVVIAIIGILAAILFPVFAVAREKARQSDCASNEKQMLLAMLQYNQDNDEGFPMQQYDATLDGVNYVRLEWPYFLSPYIKTGNTTLWSGIPITNGSGGVYQCKDWPQIDPQQTMSYGLHYYLCPDGAYNNPAGPTGTPVIAPSQVVTNNLPGVTTPSDTILFAEKGLNVVGTGYSYPGYWVGEGGYLTGVANPASRLDLTTYGDCDQKLPSGANSSQFQGCGGMPRYRHSNVMNAAFCDGHVKAITRGNLVWQTNVYVAGLKYYNGGVQLWSTY